MKNTGQSQPKQTQGQRKLKGLPVGKNQSLQERQLPEMTVPASDEKFRLLFEAAQDGILLLDAETGVISEVNPFVVDLLGYSRAELIGKKLWDTGPFKGVTASRNAFLKFQKKNYFRYEDLPIETKDGRHRKVEFVSNVYQVGSQKIIQCNIRDITERRQAENALAESEARYRAVFDNASLGIFQSGLDGRIIAVNPEFARMFGYKSPEEFVALVRDATDIFADPQRRAEIIRLRAENPDLTRFENLYRRKDGSTFFGNLIVRQVTGPDGHELFFEGFIEDITERKQADAALRENEEKYRSLFENMVEGAFYKRADGTLVDVNQSALEMLGLTRDQFLMRTSYHPEWEFIREDGSVLDSEQHPSMIALRTGKMVRDVVVGIYNPQKRNYTWVRINAIPQFKPGKDKPYQVFVTLHDITGRKQMEDALRLSEEKFSKAFHTSPDSVNINRLSDGRYIEINQGFTQLTGYTAEDVEGKTSLEINIWANPDDRTRLVKELREHGGMANLEAPFRLKDGTVKTGLISAAIITVNGEVCVLSITRDITERKQAEDALRESEQRYRTLAEAAHDMIFVINRQGRVEYINEFAAQAIGRETKDTIGKRPSEFFSPETSSRQQQNIQKVFKTGQPVYSEAQAKFLERMIWLDTWLTPIKNATGEVVSILGISRDITERKHVEKLQEVIYRIARAADQAESLDTLYPSIHTSIQEVMAADNFYIAIYDEKNDLLSFPYFVDEEDLPVPPQKPGKGLTEYVLRKGKSVLCDESLLEELKRSGEVELVGARSPIWLGVPLMVEGKAIGVMAVQDYKNARAYGEREQRVLEFVSSQAAMAIYRKRSEENLRESRHMLRLVLDTIPVRVFWKDRDSNFLGCNQPFAMDSGLHSPEELIGKNDYEMGWKEQADLYRSDDRLVIETGQPKLNYEEPQTTPDGGRIWLRTSKIPLKNAQGQITGVLGTYEDITARKQAEDALAASEAELRALFASMHDVVLVIDRDGIYRKVAPTNPDLLVRPPEELLGKTLADIFPAKQAKAFLGSVRKVLKTRQTAEFEYQLTIKDRAVWFLAVVTPMTKDETVWVVRDITERKQAEDHLRESEEKFRKAFVISPDSVNINRLQDGMYIAINKGFTQIMGYTEAECVGKTSIELNIWDNPEDRKTLVAGLIKNGEVVNYEARFRAKNGDIKYGLMSASVLELNNIPHIINITRDITERKRAEDVLAQQAEELRQRNEELARLYRASGSLISGASLNLQELAGKIVEVVQQEFGQANCSLLIVQKDTNELVHLAAAGPYVGQVKCKNLVLDGPGLIPRAIRTNKVINVGDVHSDPDYVQGWAAAQSELAIPLTIGNNAIGVIDIQRSEPDAFSPDDERLMTIFAERAALAIEHAHLNAQTESRMQQLIALRIVDMAIGGSFDINLTLGVLLDQIIGQLGVHAADILIYNAAAQTFKFSCERGFRIQTLRHTQLNFGAGYAWRLVRERQVINVPDIKKSPDGLQRSPDLSGEQFVAYVGIPLIAKGQIKGVLEIFHREPIKFEPEWYRFLELLAGQAAIAIDNAELFDNLQSSNSELSMAYDSTLEGWASALELRDNETEGHTRRATELTTRLAQAMGIKESDMVHIYRGALLHDIGKMGVPDSIVLKPGPLTEDEWVTMRKHPQYAYDMLSPISYLRLALDIPYCHHEKWDGTGYPRGLKGEQIPLSARIFAVVDAWDALTTNRPYRKAWAETQARHYIQEQSGRHFDPEVVKAFLKEIG